MKKIKKLNIIKETIVREKKCKVVGYRISQQQYNVIEDKINEIIDYLSSLKK